MRSFILGLTMLVAFGAANADADRLGYNDILGKWCGDSTDYLFSRRDLTVYWHSNAPKRIWAIKRYEFSDDTINVIWDFGGNTIFGEFSDDNHNMAQQPNTSGDMGPRRKFHRC